MQTSCKHILHPASRYSAEPAELWCETHQCNSGACPSAVDTVLEELLTAILNIEKLTVASFERQDQIFAELQRLVTTLDLFVQRVSPLVQRQIQTERTYNGKN